jgi:exopolysaccharide biosynthesis protein
MKRGFNLFVIGLFVLLSNQQDCAAQITGFKKIRWEKEKIAQGLVWKSSHTTIYDSVPQNINMLLVNLKKRKISILYDPAKNITVSRQASAVKSIAAVNGGFFNVKNGGSATYIRTGGMIVDTDTATKWSRNANMTGVVLISNGRELFIKQSTTNSWFDSHPEYYDVLVTGPLLVEEGSLVKLPKTSLVTNKHPRTAIGIKNRNKIILITLDGRTTEAAGMTLYELAELMKSLKCRDAVNLDGGGSTTMWIGGKPSGGIVNMPSDNKKFDHLGERAVSDILIVK